MRVFIDGENLRHRLVEILLGESLIQESDDMFSLDVKRLLAAALGESPTSVRYYTTRITQPDFEIPQMLEHKIGSIKLSQSHWVDMLTQQGVEVIKAGNLKIHENAPCYHCGRRTMVLMEKGVDVRMASEMVMAAVHDGEKDIVVLSSDADMLPALEIVQKAGARVTYLCFGEEVNDALHSVTDRMVTYDRQQVVDAFSGRIDGA